MKKALNSELLIKGRIWNNETLELIDFTNYDYEKTEIKTQSSGTLSKINKTITFTKGKNIGKTPFELFSINHNDENGFFYLNIPRPPKELIKVLENKCIYMVFKGNKYKNLDNISQKYYKLSQGDIIKLGRIYLKVLDIKVENETPDFSKFGTDINIINNSNHSIFRCSSFRSAKVNGQEIIHGRYNPSKQMKDNKTMKVLYSLNKDNNVNIFAKKHKINFVIKSEINNINLPFKSSRNLTRSNSAVEDFLFPSKNKQTKKNKIKIEIEEKEQLINSLIYEKESNSEEIEKNKKNRKPRVCRICYGKDTSIENPLICPCICKGSMKYIHFQCLKNWLNSKIETDLSINPEIEEEVGITYCSKDLACELCKTKFPDYINHEGKIYNISFYKPKFKQYIILESIRADKFKTKFIHILSFDHNKNQITLGRSNDCELSIPELSVSRFHCFIHKDKNKLYLEDNNSKFGTCILIQNPNILITDNSPLRLQKERTYIKLKLLMPSTFFSCCNTSTFDSKAFSYQAQNQKYCDVASSFILKVDNLDDSDNEDENGQNEENDILNNNVDDLTGKGILMKKNKNIRKIKIKEQKDITQGLINLSKMGKDGIIPLSQPGLNGMSTTKNTNLIHIKRNNEQSGQNNSSKNDENKNDLISKGHNTDKVIDTCQNKSNLINIDYKKNEDNKEKDEESHSINLINESSQNNESNK